MQKREALPRIILLGVLLAVAVVLMLIVGSASAAINQIPPSPEPGIIPPSGCDGGKVARRWNAIQEDWERDFCDDLFYAVPTQDPFDAVFGFNHGYYGWDYGQAIQYLLSEGFSASQLGTYEGQVNALVSLGLWDKTTMSVPDGADLSFLTERPVERGPGVIPNLPMQ